MKSNDAKIESVSKEWESSDPNSGDWTKNEK